MNESGEFFGVLYSEDDVNGDVMNLIAIDEDGDVEEVAGRNVALKIAGYLLETGDKSGEVVGAGDVGVSLFEKISVFFEEVCSVGIGLSCSER